MQIKHGLAIITTFFSALCYGQNNTNTCNDAKLHAELVEVNNIFEQQGFKLTQYKTLTMPSGNYMPIYVSLEQGKMYQFNFIATQNYSQYTFTLLDQDKKKLIDDKVKSKDHKNKLTRSFTAPYTGNYVVILTQKVKGQDQACGGFSVLKAVNDHKPAK